MVSVPRGHSRQAACTKLHPSNTAASHRHAICPGCRCGRLCHQQRSVLSWSRSLEAGKQPTTAPRPPSPGCESQLIQLQTCSLISGFSNWCQVLRKRRGLSLSLVCASCMSAGCHCGLYFIPSKDLDIALPSKRSKPITMNDKLQLLLGSHRARIRDAKK